MDQKDTTTKGIAVVTGASSGIGAVYADRLAKRGYDLLLVARDTNRLNTLAKRLTSETKSRVEVLTADLTKKSDLLGLEERLRTDKEITLLVNNAGMASAGTLLESNPDQLEAMIDLNITALTRLTIAVLPNFVARKTGTLVNIGSVVALAPELVGASYSGSKAYVLNFSQAVSNDVSKHGVHVQVVLPGATSTEIWARAEIDINKFPAEMVMTTDNLVDAALVGLDRKELITIPPLADEKQWLDFSAARLAMGPNLSKSKVADRYLKN